jgi:hypothetical protein
MIARQTIVMGVSVLQVVHLILVLIVILANALKIQIAPLDLAIQTAYARLVQLLILLKRILTSIIVNAPLGATVYQAIALIMYANKIAHLFIQLVAIFRAASAHNLQIVCPKYASTTIVTIHALVLHLALMIIHVSVP